MNGISSNGTARRSVGRRRTTAVEHDLELQAGEVLAEALVRAEAERDVVARAAREVDLVRLRKDLGIAVGDVRERVHRLAFADQRAADLDVGRGEPLMTDLGDREVAQQLLHGAGR